jgi:hypothetical protein
MLHAMRIVRCSDRQHSQAGGGTRTRDARFTKPVLYQLSYSGAPGW